MSYLGEQISYRTGPPAINRDPTARNQNEAERGAREPRPVHPCPVLQDRRSRSLRTLAPAFFLRIAVSWRYDRADDRQEGRPIRRGAGRLRARRCTTPSPGDSPSAATGWRKQISLHADPERRLAVADPDGRELMISCGAALFNVRLALRLLGYVPETDVLPDPGQPNAGRAGQLASARRCRRVRVAAVQPGPQTPDAPRRVRRRAAADGPARRAARRCRAGRGGPARRGGRRAQGRPRGRRGDRGTRIAAGRRASS